MELKNRPSDNPKIELTPLIDVIFLLLIFFLVTLNSFNPTEGKGKEERSYSIPVLSQTDPTLGNMVLYLFRVPADNNSNHYFYIVNQGNMAGNASFTNLRNSFWNSIHNSNWKTVLTTQLISLMFQSKLDASDAAFMNVLTQVQEVIIVCDDDIPYQHIHEYVEKIRVANITHLKIVPRVLNSEFIGPPPNGIVQRTINQITRRW